MGKIFFLLFTYLIYISLTQRVFYRLNVTECFVKFEFVRIKGASNKSCFPERKSMPLQRNSFPNNFYFNQNTI